MQIRFIAPRRPRKTRRTYPKSYRMCPLLGERKIPNNARIELWLLGAERRLVARATNRSGERVEFDAFDNTDALDAVVCAIGEGLYRLIARDRRGRIRARRDFEAARRLAPERDRRRYEPRTEAERMAAELEATKARLAEAEEERDAAREAAAMLKAAVVERDGQIEALEDAVDAYQKRLAMVRRLHARRDVELRCDDEVDAGDGLADGAWPDTGDVLDETWPDENGSPVAEVGAVGGARRTRRSRGVLAPAPRAPAPVTSPESAARTFHRGMVGATKMIKALNAGLDAAEAHQRSRSGGGPTSSSAGDGS